MNSKAIKYACVDYRLNDNQHKAIAEIVGVSAVYPLRVPGPDGIWSSDQFADEQVTDVKRIQRLTKALGADDVKAYVFVGHTTCAGHPVSDEEHARDTVEGARRMKAALETEKPLFAILAKRGETDADWTFETLEVIR